VWQVVVAFHVEHFQDSAWISTGQAIVLRETTCIYEWALLNFRWRGNVCPGLLR
jgi:hypothetical protein